jgi:ABC-type amino acid transport substrate-binding protein
VLEHFRDVIHHEAVDGTKQLMAYRLHLPAGIEGMDAVEEGRIDVFIGQRFVEVGVLEHGGHRLLGVAHEHHRGLS